MAAGYPAYGLFTPTPTPDRRGRDLHHYRISILIRFAVPAADETVKISAVVIVLARERTGSPATRARKFPSVNDSLH